ncbi:glycosyltransferase family 2 protein [Bordetella bronchialis]|uniref:Glycosyltransferase 2-like domain-containing protein n=1 Tax=Bordetella bronchialis TaxID=463025 RepID=A0A193FMU9_9BORD|nr:glycosyltransferase [Bordetella bronchialis]ANN69082.1 hypothetical protein BAU06_24730 [Bordetella bronchialis]ANN74230.1 hypothetical protein BAU08_25305 [Bordetella bronchialis]
MPKPSVSVVIPVFNQSRFIGDAVRSVLAEQQGHLEVIVVDDGSTDDSGDKVQSVFGTSVRLIRQANRGPSAAINAGMLAAEGEHIALLGGDDVCLPGRFSRQLAFARSGGHDIVFSWPVLIDGDGRRLPDTAYPVFFDTVPAPDAMLCRLLLRDNFLCAPTVLMRAEAVQRIGLFHEGLIQLQDYDYWLRACGAGCSLGISQERDVQYRRHVRNLSSNDRELGTLAEIPVVIERALDLAEPAVIRAAFRHVFGVGAEPDEPLSAVEKSLFLMAHPRSEVRARGMQRWIGLFDDSSFPSVCERLRLDPFKILYNSASVHADPWRYQALARRTA